MDFVGLIVVLVLSIGVGVLSTSAALTLLLYCMIPHQLPHHAVADEAALVGKAIQRLAA
jgi:hypothetical protein